LNTCPLLTDFLQLGGINSTAQVFKLQAFLKEIEGINVNFTGVFDSNTELAVKTFQAKYLADIMGPWKSNTPSGIVYITTKKKINEIACKSSSLTLTPAELATISTYLANLQNGSTTAPTIENGTGTTTGTTSPLIGGANDNSANTASVINANILQRIWNFLKSIF
jgi:peptidoglycan hydrolase-like protein with peptidoglycan-binding domain